MIYGYARVSTATQGRDGNSLEEQRRALELYGCQEIVEEAFSGKTISTSFLSFGILLFIQFSGIRSLDDISSKSPKSVLFCFFFI